MTIRLQDLALRQDFEVFHVLAIRQTSELKHLQNCRQKTQVQWFLLVGQLSTQEEGFSGMLVVFLHLCRLKEQQVVRLESTNLCCYLRPWNYYFRQILFRMLCRHFRHNHILPPEPLRYKGIEILF